MQYVIEGTPMPVVTCTLTRGEQMITESGGMCWMSKGMAMNTEMKGGLFKGLGRMISGESLFVTTYECREQSGYIAFASSFAGSIIPFKLGAGRSIIAQKSAFLAGEAGIKLDVFFQKKLGSGLFGGEGFIMQKLGGDGTVFLEIDGYCVEKNLAPGEVLKVDSGHIAAFSEGVGFDIETIKGVKNVLFGGEGLFNTVMTGPGTVWLQTMPAINVAKTLIPYLPSADK